MVHRLSIYLTDVYQYKVTLFHDLKTFQITREHLTENRRSESILVYRGATIYAIAVQPIRERHNRIG